MKQAAASRPHFLPTYLPLLAAFGLEILAFVAWLIPSIPLAERAGFIDPLAISVALIILASGVLPALLKPDPANSLAGCFAIVFASFLSIPYNFQPASYQSLSQIAAIQLAPTVIFRLANAAILPPLALHLTARFPAARSFPTRRLAWIYLVSLAGLVAILFIQPSPMRLLLTVGMVTWSFVLVARAMAQLFLTSRTYATRDPRLARQARLLFLAVLIAEIPTLLRPLLFLTGFGLLPYDFILALQMVIPLTLAYSVLRLDLFGIDAILRRAAVYGVLSLLVLAFYFAVTLSFAAIFSRSLPAFRTLLVGLTVLTAALAFEPSRNTMQGWIDRWLYPERLAFKKEIASLRQALNRVRRVDQIADLLETTLPARLGAAWGRLEAGASLASWIPTARSAPLQPNASPPAWSAPLIAGEQGLGIYSLGPRLNLPHYDEEEQSLLYALVQQAALACAYAQTYSELEIMNRQLESRVDARTAQVLEQQKALAVLAERQHLARELHDSISQNLFSIGLSARALRNLARKDLEAAAAGLSELEQSALQTQSEMKLLLEQLRSAPEPSGSDDRVDMVQPITQYIQEVEDSPSGRSGPEIEVFLPPACLADASVAHAILMVAREAIHNSLKHSQANHITCRLEAETDHIWLEIRDDGRGFEPEGITSGFGLKGMRERAEAIAAKLDIESAPGEGCTIRLSSPRE